MKTLDAQGMIERLESRGWYFVRQRGSSHRIYKNNNNPSILIIVPYHKGKDLPPGTQRAIMRDAGIKPSEL